jgi:hypothetical protein
MLVGVKGKKEMIFIPLQSLGMARQGNTGPHLPWEGPYRTLSFTIF